MNAPLRVAFAGTPEFAAVALAAILEAGHEVPLVLTQPDRPAGRGMKLTASPVKQLALARGIAVDQPEKLRTAEQRARLAACAPDVLVVAAYGLILPRAVLELPRFGCLNIHASLLPRWRGAAPIQRAILAGDAESGVTIMQMDEGLDTGPMLLQERTEIDPHETGASLHDRLSEIGAHLVVAALDGLAQGRLAATPQPADGILSAAKLSREEARLDWRKPAHALERQTVPPDSVESSRTERSARTVASRCGVTRPPSPPDACGFVILRWPANTAATRRCLPSSCAAAASTGALCGPSSRISIPGCAWSTASANRSVASWCSDPLAFSIVNVTIASLP